MNAPASAPFAPSAAMVLGHYHLHFAQRPRGTRDAALLRTLAAALEASGAQRHAPSDEEPQVPEAERQATLAAWTLELEAIEQEQARLGTTGQAVIWRVDQSRLVLARVARTLDTFDENPARPSLAPLLRDIDQALERLVQSSVEDAPQDAQKLQNQLVSQLHEAKTAVMRRQKDHDALVLQQQRDDMAQARLLVRTSQWLMERFDQLVSGRSQLVIRPALLEQLADDLSQQALALEKLKGGVLDSEEHRLNCRTLAEHSQGWLEESRNATLLRRQRTPDELAQALAQEADDVLEATAQIPLSERGTRQPSWRLLCDRMDELWRQMDGLSLIYGMDAHRNTEAGLTDSLAYLAAPWLA